MAVDMKLIKRLREITGAGVVDCKKALQEAQGDIDKAVEILRKKGIAKAEKKASRETKEGLVTDFVSEDRKTGVLVEVNCETDFVARNDLFKELTKKLAKFIAKNDEFKNVGIGNVEKLKAANIEDGKTVEEFVKEYIAKIGENIQIKRFARFDSKNENERFFSYIHPPGKIGVLLGIEVNENALKNEDVKNLIKDLTLQIAAMRPQYLTPEEIPQEILNKEREIIAEEVKRQGKPEHIIPKIVEGKLSKFYEEVCLLKQPYIRDDKVKVEKLIKEITKKVGEDIKVTRFVRFEVGM